MKTELSTLELLRNSWIKSGVRMRPGVAKKDIERFEERHGIRIPEDLARYFETVDGMDDGDTDVHDIRFWRLAEVQSVIEEIPESDPDQFAGYFVFADYSLWAHGYAIRLSRGGNEVVIVGGGRPIPVSLSFQEFLELYLHQPHRLF